MNLTVRCSKPRRFALCYYDEITSGEALKLSDGAFRLWIVLHSYAPKERWRGWSTSAERLAADCGFSRSTIFRALAELRGSDLVSVLRKGRANTYVLLAPLHPNFEMEETEDSPANDTHEPSAGSSGEPSAGSSGDTLTDLTNHTDNLGRFLEGTLRHLLEELETWQDRDQQIWLLGDMAKYRDAALPWCLKESFKDQCEGAELGYPAPVFDRVLNSALDSFSQLGQKSANKRRAFLTECQEIVREYGRQL
jgi:hypothetical protein